MYIYIYICMCVRVCVYIYIYIYIYIWLDVGIIDVSQLSPQILKLILFYCFWCI